MKAGQITPLCIDGGVLGSLVVVSERPEATRIRQAGTEAWSGPNPAAGAGVTSDEMRFDFLPPGAYEVAVQGGERIVGTVAVGAGEQRRFDIDADR